MILTFRSGLKVKELLASLTSDFEPDSIFPYSNSGYILLGYILEDLYGKKYQDLVKEKIADPLGLDSYGFMTKVNPDENVVYSQCRFFKEERVYYISINPKVLYL
ncbi:MAG: CubicO group peptidase (beta-lactamase class C family) [Saprospiraceae bacterium]|jgi:CubicO group peptidase (beta-lactamase class C family)